jgi:hypothetical protein
MVFIIVLAAILFALMFPETPAGRFAKRHFVDAPAQWLNDFNWFKFLALIAFVIAHSVCSTAFPPGMALFAAGELTAYLEIVAAFLLLTSRLRIRHVVSSLFTVLRPVILLMRRLAGGLRARVLRLRPARQSKFRSSDEDDALVAA